MPGPTERTVHIGLGGNIGDPRAAMQAALVALDASGAADITAVSSLYRTPPWGKVDQPPFLNAAAALKTSLDARSFLTLCLDTERSLKRERRERWGPRLIDIDILTFGEERIEKEGLSVPHPRMAERAFVMLPLAEIAPELMVNGERAQELASRLDATGIERLEGPRWWR